MQPGGFTNSVVVRNVPKKTNNIHVIRELSVMATLKSFIFFLDSGTILLIQSIYCGN